MNREGAECDWLDPDAVGFRRCLMRAAADRFGDAGRSLGELKVHTTAAASRAREMLEERIVECRFRSRPAYSRLTRPTANNDC